jgi:hypothetical protein
MRRRDDGAAGRNGEAQSPQGLAPRPGCSGSGPEMWPSDRDAAPARDGSQPLLPGGAGDPPGDTTISRDGFADG